VLVAASLKLYVAPFSFTFPYVPPFRLDRIAGAGTDHDA